MSFNSLITNLDRALIDARALELKSALLQAGESALPKVGERKHNLARPRIWVGERTNRLPHWWHTGDEWERDDRLRKTDIFVPGHLPKPTCSPADFTYLETCSVADWKVP